MCQDEGSGIFPAAINCSKLERPNFVSFNQSLWPPHCVAHTRGADLAEGLVVDSGGDYILRKGTNCAVDSYSAFELNGHLGSTGLNNHLRALSVNTVFVTGIALDFCVKQTALDARALGYTTFVIVDATRATSSDAVAPTIADLRKAGVHVIYSKDLNAIGLRAQPSRYFGLFFAIPFFFIMAFFVVLTVRLMRSPYAAEQFDDPPATTDDDRKPLLLD